MSRITYPFNHTQSILRWLFVVFGIATLPLHAAQLIDNIPSQLERSWFVCSVFETAPRQCVNADLPFEQSQLDKTVRFQTYTKDVIISSELKKQPLGIWIENVDDVDTILFNGEFVGKTGEFLPDYDTGFRQSRLYLIPSEIILYNQFNRIEIQTFSSRNKSGLSSSIPTIGNFLTIQSKIQQLNYPFIIVIAMLLLLIVFPVFYFIVLKGNYETVHYILFLIGFAAVAFARSQIPNSTGLNLSSMLKLEVFALNLGVVGICLFIFRFFELELRNAYAAGLYLLGVSGLTIIIWPQTLQIRFLMELNFWLIIVVIFFVNGSALVIALHKQRKYAATLGMLFVIGWLILIYDAIMHSSTLLDFEITMRPQVLTTASAIFGLILALTLTHKYWDYFKGSTYDHLTGTLLRPAFFQRLAEEMQRCHRGDGLLLVAVIDIQQARKISANYGYSIGNHLLTTVSNSLTKVLRPYDLICRFSDEQFCIAAAITDRESAENCLQRMYSELVNIQQPINDSFELFIDARIGGVVYDLDQHLSVSHIIQDANYALSKSKSESQPSFLLDQSPLITF